ncbi:MAG: sulfotransferase [Chitinophagaceae bacterium]
MYKLAFSLFSLDPQNMRWFSLKRLLVVLIIVPLFILFLLINRFCLFWDIILFPQFKNQKIISPVFIIAAPRTATTYLYHLLAADDKNFTTFSLWEIIFAPSIIQKYFILGYFKMDKWMGSPIKKIILFLEKKIFGDFTRIHKIGLGLPEEDEAILLWNMSTIYLNFFFPDTNHFADYFAFDKSMAAEKKIKIMRFYASCVLRHNYVFNRNHSKRFLSKNPAMMAKVESLYSIYPDANVLNINRCPGATIPSTIALNNNIYRFFSSKKPSQEMNNQTKSTLIEWYRLAHINLDLYFPDKTIYIDFRKLIRNEHSTLKMICDQLGLEYDHFVKLQKKLIRSSDHKSSNRYDLSDDSDLRQILGELPFMIPYCEYVGS